MLVRFCDFVIGGFRDCSVARSKVTKSRNGQTPGRGRAAAKSGRVAKLRHFRAFRYNKTFGRLRPILLERHPPSVEQLPEEILRLRAADRAWSTEFWSS